MDFGLFGKEEGFGKGKKALYSPARDDLDERFYCYQWKKKLTWKLEF